MGTLKKVSSSILEMGFSARESSFLGSAASSSALLILFSYSFIYFIARTFSMMWGIKAALVIL